MYPFVRSCTSFHDIHLECMLWSSMWQFDIHWRDCHLLVCICFCTLLVSSWEDMFKNTGIGAPCMETVQPCSFRLWKFEWRVRILRNVKLGLCRTESEVPHEISFPTDCCIEVKSIPFARSLINWCWIGINGKGRFKQFKSSSWEVNQQT